MTYDQLEEWSNAAAQTLQEVCDEAQAASKHPNGTDQRQDIRELLTELDDLMKIKNTPVIPQPQPSSRWSY